MKMKVALFLFFVLISGSMNAQNSSTKDVAQAVEQLRLAMIQGDSTLLNRLVADDVSYGHSSGKIEGKASFIRSLMDGTSRFLSIELKEQTIQISGDVALVRHQLFANVQDKGKDPAAIRLGVLLVCQKRADKWQLIARQAYKLP
jgi:ketosteroid isomerase-like protein